MDDWRLRSKIAEIAGSPKNLRFQELETLLENHFRERYPNFDHRQRGSHHVFTVGNQTIVLVEPSSGCVKRYIVEKFLEAMEELGWYEREEE